MIITDPDHIEAMRLIVLKGRLKLEVLGLHFNGRPSGVIVREITGLKQRNKAKLLVEYEEWLKEKGIIV